ncbi:unnamed protein product [Ambrosiozyma monospora]|uniref:Unnamed protein product n=1 Tax=Ambrosiozyma monospora TaxID=43982 RepID=A0A9W7DI29_AMBMO|nr:unnamed protein product [Ambrosiozyma monospora]
MSLGTLYGSGKTRTILPVGLVKALDLDVKLESTDSPAYKAAFPLGKVPAFVGPKGFKLHEVLAVSIYLVSLKDEKSPLLGKNAKEYAQVLKWLSFGTAEFLTNSTNAFAGLLGAVPYNKRVVDDAQAAFNAHVEKVIEPRLKEFTYLVGERLTLADLFVASTLYRPLTTFAGSEWRAKHPYITRWFNTVAATPYLSYFFDSVKLADKPIDPPKPQKKEKKAKGPKPDQAPKKAAKAEKKVEEVPAEPKKPKHPLELLGCFAILLE